METTESTRSFGWRDRPCASECTTCPIVHAPRKVLQSFLKINHRRAIDMAEEKTG